LLPLELTQDEVDRADSEAARTAGREEGAIHARGRPFGLRTPTCWWPSAPTADFFEAVAKGRDAKLAANWVINELAGRLNKEGQGHRARPCRPRNSARFSI
jgi:aspartyl-tRNA(Asn)/glutamyl-tRNA(Gln) amidotransferase subunit B